ncbi:MAG: septum formation protein Maf [Clostridia bacterium]|nr:septum formation protein Maf [Clostridia bacterium]
MIILASKSPRREEICRLIGLEFEIIPAKNECDIDLTVAPEEAIRKVAEAKAQEVFRAHSKDIVIGADTAVYACGEFLGKPKSEQEAFQMLKKLSGKTHQVFTGVSIILENQKVSFCEKADVEFSELTDSEILEYIASKDPMDKAGAYGIQGKGAKFVQRINGDFYTVMGLPCARLYNELKAFDVF